MDTTAHAALLRRKIAASPGARRDAPRDRTVSIARLAQRAFFDCLGMRVAVTEVADTRSDGPAALASAIAQATLIAPLDGKHGRGLAALSSGALAAIVEQAATGQVSDRKLRDRAGTSVDLLFCRAVLDRIATGALGPDHTVCDAQPVPPDRVALELADSGHRLLRLSLTLDDRRDGILFLACPLPAKPRPSTEGRIPRGKGTATLASAIGHVEIPLTAELARVRVPLKDIREWRPGAALDLPRSVLERVMLRGSDGAICGQGKLGQAHGRRAVRVGVRSSEPVPAEISPPPEPAPEAPEPPSDQPPDSASS